MSRSGDPTAQYSDGGAEMRKAGNTYIKKNPHLARQAAGAAASGAASFARDNPQMVQDAAINVAQQNIQQEANFGGGGADSMYANQQ